MKWWAASNTRMVFLFYLCFMALWGLKNASIDLQVIKEKCTADILLQHLLIDMLERFEGGKSEPFHLKWVMTGGEVIQKSIVQGEAEPLSLQCDIDHTLHRVIIYNTYTMYCILILPWSDILHFWIKHVRTCGLSSMDESVETSALTLESIVFKKLCQ